MLSTSFSIPSFKVSRSQVLKPQTQEMSGDTALALKEQAPDTLSLTFAGKKKGPVVRSHPLSKEELAEIKLSNRFADLGLKPDTNSKPISHPLHQAVNNGEIGEVISLLNQGHSPNQEDDTGSTPTHLAAKKGSYSMLKLLKDAGADLWKENDEGITPNDYAYAQRALSTEEYRRIFD